MIKAEDIARTLGAEIQGDGKVVIKGMRAVAFAQEGDLTFAMDESEMKKAAATKAACVMTTIKADNFPKTVLYVKDMKGAMTAAYNLMERTGVPPKGTIHPTAIVDKTAAIGKNVSIGAHTIIGRSAKIGDNSMIGANSTIGDNVSIGDFTRIYANVSIYDYSFIGSKVIIHSGAVIGADGFGFIPSEKGLLKVPQMGRAVLEDEVEIGANSCVDRGTFTDTVVGRGTKIDNLVQVAHNVKIGRNVIMAGQSGIAGSSTIGDNTMVGGQVGISDHVNIGRNTKIAAQSGVTKNTKGDNAVLFGYPARNLDEWIEHNAFSRWLFRHSKKLKSLLRED